VYASKLMTLDNLKIVTGIDLLEGVNGSDIRRVGEVIEASTTQSVISDPEKPGLMAPLQKRYISN